ncbi:uncharacterized protein EV420DRAFT_1680463 [Desarmillaria tabescens]|uniref:Uncharacterized protein n=1 Tax=Armillaria tabescens TaxID=1929756 RepID=A0AA39N5S5_ARMTA|nr:uncharacterized protein EV420DRAFT_1680463 [Desarmillaria tabescens]KAK0458464.1 hypothetical protein EV420DRAFT_1680463 [Desarmillaria tabescens]
MAWVARAKLKDDCRMRYLIRVLAPSIHQHMRSRKSAAQACWFLDQNASLTGSHFGIPIPIPAAEVAMRMQALFSLLWCALRSRVRPEVRPIPDAFPLHSRGWGVSHHSRELLRQGCGFKVEMGRGWTFMGTLLPRSSMTHCEQRLRPKDPLELGYTIQRCANSLRLWASCMFHPQHPSWLVDAGALPASPPVQRIVILGDPDVRLVHPLLDNPLLARTVLVVPSSNPAKWIPVGERSSSVSLVILRTNKKHSKGGALHLLSVLQRAARTPLRLMKQYSQYDYEGREEMFGFVPMSTMAEDTSEVESAGVLPIPSFHAVINFLDGRPGSEREALRTGILTTSLVGGFLLTGNGKRKTQLTAPRRTSRLSFLSRRPSPAPTTTTEQEAEHGTEERCAHPISTTKPATHYDYILPFNLLLSSYGPSILDFVLAGALDGGGSKAWIRSVHDVRVTGGSVKMKGSGLPTPPDSEEDLDGVKGGYQMDDSPPSYVEGGREKTLRALEKGKERERVGSALGKNPVRYSQPLSRGGPIRVSKSDGTEQNTRRSTSRDRRRSECSKPEHGYSQSRSKSDHGHRPTRATVPVVPQRAQTVSSKHTSRSTKPSRSPTSTNSIPKPSAPSIPRSPTVARPHPVHHAHTHARRPSDTHVSHVLPSLPTPRSTPPIPIKNTTATWDTREKPLPRILRRKEGKLDARQRSSWFLSFWGRD